MRFFEVFPAALSEIKRDLAEMGVPQRRLSWQGRRDEDHEEVIELRNYGYTVKQPFMDHLEPTQPWAEEEFKERVSKERENPGVAWTFRKEVWEELLERAIVGPHLTQYFSYTYNERMQPVIEDLIQLLVDDPTTRRAYLPIYQPDDLELARAHRVPCTLGYYFLPEDDKLHLTYMMRSCDFTTHFQNDVWLALKLRDYIVKCYNGEAPRERIPMKPGEFCHFITNLHVFRRDVEGVF